MVSDKLVNILKYFSKISECLSGICTVYYG